jgi:hypothetical protein
MNQPVQDSIGYKWQVLFYASSADAEKDRKLFWFYLETTEHKAVKQLNEGLVVAIA